ncbi:MAG TPA: serine hydrolase domain-containing protein [Kribbellaceae bacterium]|nr:serine hydrolase domain-containing protein [Kribbellaceae bacterium]
MTESAEVQFPHALSADAVREVAAYWGSLLEFAQGYLRVPGIQAAVYAGDQVVWSGAFGHADVERDVPLTERHLFRIASHSKTFTATAIMQLAEQGRLRLDDTAATQVPEVAGTPVGEARIADLLSHAAGVTRDSRDGDHWLLTKPFLDRAELIEVLRSAESAVLPANERFKYSNIGYGLLGLVVEAAGGTSYNDYVTSAIVGKLGLADLGPELDPARADDYATGYSALSYASSRVPIEHVDTRALASATGFYGSARDLVTYFAAHLPGDVRLLTDDSKRRMQHPVWPVKTGDPDGRYALGLSVVKIGDRDYFGHGGGYPGHITRTLADPERRFVVSVLTSCVDGPALRLAQTFVKLVDRACEPYDDQPAAADLRRFTGRFANLWGVSDIALLGGRLFGLDPTVEDPAGDAAELEFVDDHSLRLSEKNGYGSHAEPVTFEFDAEGNIVSLRGGGGTTRHPLASFALPERVPAARE